MPIIYEFSAAFAKKYIVVGPELHKVSEFSAPKYHFHDYVVVRYNNQYFLEVVIKITEN